VYCTDCPICLLVQTRPAFDLIFKKEKRYSIRCQPEPPDAACVRFDFDLIPVQEVVQVGDGFPGGHDEIALGDAAFKQRRKGIHGPYGFFAENAQFVQPGLMLEYQFIQARPGAPEGLSMGGQNQHIIRQVVFEPLQ
jgi:hypothetical protein